MAGAIIENMSGRKLAMIGSVLILCQIICFLVGAVFSPAPNNSDQFLATKVTDKEYRYRKRRIFRSSVERFVRQICACRNCSGVDISSDYKSEYCNSPGSCLDPDPDLDSQMGSGSNDLFES
jgi:hypothetical protein